MNTFEQRRQIAHYRAAFHDMPVAGPMDGAAYGEYLKSKGIGMVIGVVASVVTMGAAAPLMTSAFLATQIAGGVMMAGGVLSGVGAVTGNKKLAKIGGIMSLAGGIGAAASGLTNGLGMGAGSGTVSDAMKSVGNSFMDSVNAVTGAEGLGIGDVYGGRAAELAAASGEGNIPLGGGTEGPVPSAGEFTVEQPGPAAEAGVSADGTIAQRGSAGELQLASGDDATTKLLQQRAANPAGSGQVDLAGAERTAGSQIDPANITNDSTPKRKAKLAADQKVDDSASDKLFMGMDKTALMKTGAGLLEKGAAAAFAPDEEAKMDALITRYNAETTKLTTENDILQYKKANAGKQVAMIAANDPQMEQKVAAAAAAGHPVAFIPSVASAGVTPTNGGANMAAPTGQRVAAQTPVRQPNYA